MKKYIMCLMLILFSQPVFGAVYASKLDRVTDADMRTAVLRAGLTVGDFGGSGLISSGTPYYVDSTNGADNRSGKTWALAVATIDQAIDLIGAAITAGTEKGRPIIYIREGYGEDSTRATAAVFDADVAGLTLWGLGSGSQMPTIDYGFTSSTCVIGADNITLYNIRFRPSTNTVVVGLDIESGADYWRIIDCVLGEAETAGDEFSISLRFGTATGGEIRGCKFLTELAQAVNMISSVGQSTNTSVIGNTFYGDTSGAIWSGTVDRDTGIQLFDNTFYNGEPAGLGTTSIIQLLDGSTGIASNNRVAVNLTNMSLAFRADGMFFFGNLYNETAGGSNTAFDISLVAATSTVLSISPADGE